MGYNSDSTSFQDDLRPAMPNPSDMCEVTRAEDDRRFFAVASADDSTGKSKDGHDSRGRNYKAETQLPTFTWASLPI